MTYTTASKIMDKEALARKLLQWRLKDEKIVFTNGCFDLLHLGHVDYLEKASLLGTRLVVGVNSDASVTRIKGEGRPIQDQESRSRVIAALEFVEGVIIFEEDTPLELITFVKPDVLVKGDDYTVEEIVGHEFVKDNGGEVQTIALVQGYSTSRMIDSIKNA
ncbi:MAG: D-glycero-beta-D-manno-heptose 1-phosphate adenylyltransferase [Bacteroidia bacterium]|nr:D-glycero-beta-D-manno-heptose 1-phosphate adenylyltransferase [Bacteroidia bacterium]